MAVQGSPSLTKFLTEEISDIFGGRFEFESDPVAAARVMIDHIDAKRSALSLPGPMYDVPYAPRDAAATATA
jgi:carbon-monoxide dehydrogenase catalytic subunit